MVNRWETPVSASGGPSGVGPEVVTQSPQDRPSVFDRMGPRHGGGGEPAPGWRLPRADKEADKEPRSAREARLSRADDDEGEEGEGGVHRDGSPRTEGEAADREVDRRAAEATAGEGEQGSDSDSTATREGGQSCCRKSRARCSSRTRARWRGLGGASDAQSRRASRSAPRR